MKKFKRIAMPEALAVAFIVAIVATGAIAYNLGKSQSTASASSSDIGISFSNPLSVEVKHPACDDLCLTDDNGAVLCSSVNVECGSSPETKYAKNIVTLTGFNWTREILAGFMTQINRTDIIGNWTNIGLSPTSNTPAVGDSTCADAFSGSGLQPKQATTIIREPPAGNVGNYTVSVTFSPTGTGSITVICLMNGTATTSPLMASASITNTTVLSGDSLIVNYSVAVK